MNRTTAIRLLFAALGVCFFAAPIGARLVGITAEQFENRRLADAPRLSQGWDAFQQTGRYFTDHMPLRAQAVRLNTQIWTDVFSTDPRYTAQTALADDPALPFAGSNAQGGAPDRQQSGKSDLQGPVTARTGRQGWLFVGHDIQAACSGPVPDALILKRWASLVQATRNDGRSAVMFAVPHKASVYPEYLSSDEPNKECALEGKDRLWNLLSDEGPELGVFELRSELVRLKKRFGDALFEPVDAHWTTLGALTLVGAVLDAVGNGIELEASEVVKRGSVPYIGDLTTASGRPKMSRRIEYGIVRDRDAPRVPGRTVLICDSFAYHKMHLFKPYFEHLSHVPVYYERSEILKAIRGADRVIFEAVETNMATYARTPDEPESDSEADSKSPVERIADDLN